MNSKQCEHNVPDLDVHPCPPFPSKHSATLLWRGVCTHVFFYRIKVLFVLMKQPRHRCRTMLKTQAPKKKKRKRNNVCAHVDTNLSLSTHTRTHTQLAIIPMLRLSFLFVLLFVSHRSNAGYDGTFRCRDDDKPLFTRLHGHPSLFPVPHLEFLHFFEPICTTTSLCTICNHKHTHTHALFLFQGAKTRV